MHWTLQLLGVAIGGALGGAARFWLSDLVARRVGEVLSLIHISEPTRPY